MIKAIVFDLDDTLYRQEEPFIVAIKKVFPQLIEKDLNSFFKQFRVISDQLYEQSRLKNNQPMREVTYLRLSKAMETGFGLNVTEALTDSFERAYTQQLSQICLSHPLKKVLE